MKNIYYEKMLVDDYDLKHLTFKDFIEVCDTLKLPVFVVEIINNPFDEPHRTVSHHMYDNMSSYRDTMPEWSAREYDYENDRATCYLEYPGIADGVFDVNADNNSSSYRWHFEVVGQCVVVHSELFITD